MKKQISILTGILLFCQLAFAQEYEQYMQKGKDLLEQKNYLSAMEQFEKAYEVAESDSIETEVEAWRNKAIEKIRENLAAFEQIKLNSESAIRLALNEPKTKANADKKLYEIVKTKGINHFNKKNFFDALQLFKLSKQCPDFEDDNEIDLYLKKATDSLNAIKKIALVIGNANYVEGNLEKPIIDAQDVANALRVMKFDVIDGYNLKMNEFDEKVKQFYEKAKNYGIAVFYFTGFGHESDHMLPVDTKADAEGNLKKWFSLNYLMTEFNKWSSAKKIFILDMDRTSKSGVPPTVMSYHNCLVVYSAAPNNKAFNGVGRNSLFTEQLLKFLATPNTSFQEIFRLTREATMRVSKNRQVPTIYDNIQNDIYLNWKLDR